jgi:DNA-binding winged helix-turn-helix (wHTH) protein
MAKYDFSRRFGRWLERSGFTDDPFALYKAEQEGDALPLFFIDRPYLHDLVDDPSRPQAAFLMADRGEGKTATREMVAYECMHGKLRRRALGVRYYDFSPLLEQVNGDLTQLNARHHVHVIVRYTLKAMAEDVPAIYYDHLEETDAALLVSFVEEFADAISRLRLRAVLPHPPASIDWDSLSARETLEVISRLVTKLGRSSSDTYESVYVLVDRVDESAAGPKAAVPLLEPLVREGPLLEMPHMAFKFFLPIEVGQELRQTVNLRPDRICLRTIKWNGDALQEVIRERLKYYSNEKVNSFEQLCTPGAKRAVERLINESQGSPRTLIRMCRALIHYHVRNFDAALITWPEVMDTIAEFGQQLDVEREPTPVRAPTAEPETPPEDGLFLTSSGHVWVDGEAVTPPLSELEFRLLNTLYRHSPDIVSHDELIETVWSSAWASSGEDGEVTDEQNLRKLVARLRKRLPGERARFIRNVRGRGYWLHVG